MDINTFDSSEKYKSLIYISEEITKYPLKYRGLSRLLYSFNRKVKYISTIKDIETRKFTLDILRDFYIEKVNSSSEKYDISVLSRVENFIKAKINNNKN
jgi:hypothetical protein